MAAHKQPDRWRTRFARHSDTGCWEWTGTILDSGYGQYWSDGRGVYAHRYVYEQLVGPIPDGLTLDHLCRNRRCVNPAHLEPVTHRTNIHRGVAPTAENAAKTHCVRGHEFTPENTYIRTDGVRRTCRACMRMHIRAYQERNRERLRQKRRDYVARNRDEVNARARELRRLRKR